MTRDPRYDVLYEPVRIGPLHAPNCFYQVPHCNGMGFLRPRMVAEMRGIEAEGGLVPDELGANRSGIALTKIATPSCTISETPCASRSSPRYRVDSEG